MYKQTIGQSAARRISKDVLSHDEGRKQIRYQLRSPHKLPEKPKKEDPPPPPGSPEIKLNADKDDTNFDTDSTIDDKEPEKPRINMFDDRIELRNYLDEKRKRQRDNTQEENKADNHQQKHTNRCHSTKSNTPESQRSRSRPRRNTSESSRRSSNQRRESERH
jgi:hypothetical protein